MSLKEKITKEKGASDFIAYYIHQPIENYLVSKLMHTFVTPNQVTAATNIVAYMVTYLYFSGRLWMGIVLSFIVGVLDGLDGKLARAKEMSTNLGKLEHALDLLYEFSWIIALGYYFTVTGGTFMPLLYGFISVTLISFYRMVYDVFGKATGTSLDNFGPVERIGRRIAGRRNLYNLHILGGVVMNSPLCMLTIMIHAALTAVFYTWRAGLHLYRIDQLNGGTSSIVNNSQSNTA